MKALAIAACDLRLRLRDASFWLEAIGLPVVVTLILGSALGGVRAGHLPQTRVALYAADTDTAEAVLGEVLRSSTLLSTTIVPTESEGLRGLKHGEYEVLVSVPEGATAALRDGQPLTLKVLGASGHQLGAAVVKDMVTSALTSLRAQMAARRAAAATLEGAGLDPTAAWQSPSVPPASASIRAAALQGSDLIGTYIVGMAVFFVLMTALRLAGIMKQQLQGGLADRLGIAPVSAWTVLSGRVLSLGLVGFLQMGITLAITRYFFHVRWVSGWLMTLLAAVAVFSAVSLALALMALPIRKENRGGVNAIFSICSALLGGSFIPLDSVPGWMRWISALTYNYWAGSAFKLVASGAQPSGWLVPAMVLALYGAAAFGCASLLGARRMTHA